MEYMPDFTLHRPTAIEDAVKLRSETDNARFVAGGTDMIVNVRRGIEQPAALIDLTAIEELKTITEDTDESRADLLGLEVHARQEIGHGIRVIGFGL